MTPPCANCHEAPGSPSLSEEMSAPPCPAEIRWPEWISASDPELRHREAWVRSNFEMAREHPLPFRIDVESAEANVDIRFRPGTRSFFPIPWSSSPYHALGVEFSPGASLHSQLLVRDNALPLGLRNLLEIQGVFLDGPLGFNFWPERLSVGNYGELHVIARSSAGALFFLDPFMVPRPELGHDLPSEEQWDEMEACLAAPDAASDCYPAMHYPNHRGDPRIDRVLTRHIPAEILDPNGRLPQSFNLETLLSRILDWRRAHPVTEAPDSRGPLTRLRELVERAEEWLEPGSHISLQIQELHDLFLPGLLDIGPSRGRVDLVYHREQVITAELNDFEINLDPIDLPARPGPTRPSIHLETATLSAARESADLDGIENPPGLRVQFDAASGVLWIEGNLDLQAQASFPLLGEVELEGQLLFRSSWRLDDAGLAPIPESSSLEFRRGELWESGGRRPILTGFTLSLSDLPESPDGLAPLFHSPSLEAEARLRLSGWEGRSNRLEVAATIPLPRIPGDTSYDLAALLERLSARVELERNGERSCAAEISLSSEALGVPDGHGRDLQVDFDLWEGPGGRPATQALVQGGHIGMRVTREVEGHDHYFASFRAGAIDRGPVVLRGIEGEIAVDRLQFQDGVTAIRVPELRLSMNPRGAPGGILRGPVTLLLSSSEGEGLDILWNGPERRLDVSGLDLRFRASGLRVLPPNLLALLQPSVVGIGLDGHFEGGFHAELPEDRGRWRASGDLRLRGDRDGDIYLVDAAGRRVGLPLVRDTRWRWRRVDRIDWRRRYALGSFHLDTLLNFAELLPHRGASSGEEPIAYGASGQRLHPYEINGVMPYDNQPWDLQGFRNRIVDYLFALCRQNAECRAGMEGGRAR